MTETLWSTKPKILTDGPFTEKVCQPVSINQPGTQREGTCFRRKEMSSNLDTKVPK